MRTQTNPNLIQTIKKISKDIKELKSKKSTNIQVPTTIPQNLGTVDKETKVGNVYTKCQVDDLLRKKLSDNRIIEW